MRVRTGLKCGFARRHRSSHVERHEHQALGHDRRIYIVQQTADVREAALISRRPPAFKGIEKKLAMTHLQNGDEADVGIFLAALARKSGRRPDQDLDDLTQMARTACALDIVELSVASLIDQLGAVADELTRQILLCSEIVV